MDMNNDKPLENNSNSRREVRLPDFDTLRDLAKNDPEKLEELRVALCQKVIDDAPVHARPRLEGLMFHINARRALAKSELEATREISSMMHDSLARMQSMLKDLRAIQSESILLSARNHRKKQEIHQRAMVIPFRQRK